MASKKYFIKYRYMTGNSFGSHEEIDTLELTWDNLDIAKENLKRIQEHYKWYKYIEESGKIYFNKSRNKTIPQPEWWDCKNGDTHYQHHKINLVTDNRKEIQMWCPWCGYFESLIEAEIELDSSDMKIVVDSW